MGSKSPPSAPIIEQFPTTQLGGLRRTDGSIVEGLGGQPLMLKADPNVPLNTSGVSQDIIDRIREMGGISSGLRRNDGSIVEGTTGNLPTTVNNQSMIRRPPSFFDPSQGIATIGQLPNGTGTQMPLGGFPIQIPEGGAPKIEGPAILGPGPNNIANKPLPYEFDNIGIGSLTQNPINTTPESNIMGSMTSSPYLNNNQDLDQYLNSYVENLINRRMRDIFGGIMSIFQ